MICEHCGKVIQADDSAGYVHSVTGKARCDYPHPPEHVATPGPRRTS